MKQFFGSEGRLNYLAAATGHWDIRGIRCFEWTAMSSSTATFKSADYQSPSHQPNTKTLKKALLAKLSANDVDGKIASNLLVGLNIRCRYSGNVVAGNSNWISFQTELVRAHCE